MDRRLLDPYLLKVNIIIVNKGSDMILGTDEYTTWVCNWIFEKSYGMSSWPKNLNYNLVCY